MPTKREELIPVLEALDATPNALRRDECGDFCLFGSRGHIYPWGDGKDWWIYVASDDTVHGGIRSIRHWNATKKRMPFVQWTQDGDMEGAGRMATPTPEQAAIVREVCGIHQRKRYSPEDLARFAENLPVMPTSARQNAD